MDDRGPSLLDGQKLTHRIEPHDIVAILDKASNVIEPDPIGFMERLEPSVPVPRGAPVFGANPERA